MTRPRVMPCLSWTGVPQTEAYPSTEADVGRRKAFQSLSCSVLPQVAQVTVGRMVELTGHFGGGNDRVRDRYVDA